MLFVEKFIKSNKQCYFKETENGIQQDNDEMVLPAVNDTAILEYLDILKTEYSFERDKKQSFESRTGGLLALLGAICIFYFQNIDINDFINMFFEPLTFIVLVRIIAGITMITSLIVTFVAIIRTLSAKKYLNFEVKNLDKRFLVQNKMDALIKAIDAYKTIIIQHREHNEKKAIHYKVALYGALILIFSTVVYSMF